MALPWQSTNSVSPDESSDSILCLVLGEQTVVAAYLHFSPEKITLISRSSFKQFTDKQSFITVTDACFQELHEDSEQENAVIFCMSEHWVSAEDVLPEKADWIESLLRDLQLEARGFIGLAEALLPQLFDPESKTTQMALLVFPSTVVLYQATKPGQWATFEAGRSDSITADVTELVAKTEWSKDDATLTTKIHICTLDEGETVLETIHQELIEYDWQEALGLRVPPAMQPLSPAAVADLVVEKTTQVYREKTIGSATAFVKGGAGAAVGLAGTNAVTDDPVVATSQAVFGADVAEQLPAAAPALSSASAQSSQPSQPSTSPVTASSVPPRKRKKLTRKKVVLASVLGIAVGIVVTLLSSAAYWQRHAVVLLELTPQTTPVSTELTVPLANDSIEIVEGFTLDLTTVEETVEVKGSSVTSGEQEIGEKASGSVRILNKSEQSKRFDKGTVLAASDSISFELDQDTTVPAASVSANPSGTGEIKEYGKAEAKVVAREIGADSNIKTATVLKVADFADSTYVAEALSDFSGGSSETVAIVTDKDVATLLADLQKQAKTEAQTSFDQLRDQGKRVSPPHQVEVVDRQVAPAVGEQSEQVAITAKFTFTAFSLDIADTRPLATAVLESVVPEGAQLSSAEPQILTSFEEASRSGVAPQLQLNVSSQAVTTINMDSVRSAIAGRPLRAIAESAVDIPGVTQSSVQWRPAFARHLVSTVPEQPDRVEIYVKE